MTSKTGRGKKIPKIHVSVRSAVGDAITTTSYALKKEDIQPVQTMLKTCSVEVRVFAAGDIVRPASSRCCLPPGEYRVVRFIEPIVPHELTGTVFVEGHHFGIGAEYLTVVRSASAVETGEPPQLTTSQN